MRPTAFLSAFLLSAALLPAADAVLLNMVMPDTKLLVDVNVAKAENSPFGQFILQSMPKDGFSQFTAASGFDPRTDLTEVLAANNGTKKTGLILARGRFNAAQLGSAAVTMAGFTTSVYNGAQLLTPAKAGGDVMAIVLDSTPATIALMGDEASVKAALDRRTGKNPLNPALAAKVTEYAGADAWSVSLVPLANLGAAGVASPLGAGMQGELLKKVTETSAGITFSSPIQISGEAVADTPQDAASLGDIAKFLAGMIQNSSGPAGNPMSTLLQSLTVSTNQNTVKIALSIGEADLEHLLQANNHHKAGVI